MMGGMINGTFTVFFPQPDQYASEITVYATGINTLAKYEIVGGGQYDWYGAREIIVHAATERAETDRVEAAEQAQFRFSPKLLDVCQKGLLANGINCGG
jgi:hypothetical protein